MSNIAYDIEKLKYLGIIEADGEYSNEYGSADYIVRMRRFETEAPGYLSSYNAAVVFSRETERKRLIDELKSVRASLTSLGMSKAAAELIFVEDAIFKRDVSALTVELTEFRKTMNDIFVQVVSARIHKADSAAQSEKKIILAVDDQPALLSTVVKMLQEQFTVIAVTSARAAQKVLEKHTPDLVLLDIEMPVLNGYQFARILRDNPKFENTPIIFLTTKNNRTDVIAAISHGVNDYIVKPVDKELLISKIRRFTGW